MITRLQVKNYRCLRNIDLSLDELTVLVGRNGAGKSTIIDVLHFLRDSLESGIDNAVTSRGGFRSIRRWSKNRPYQVEITVTVQEGNFWGRYALKLGSQGDSFRVLLERGEIGNSAEDIESFFERDADSITLSTALKESLAAKQFERATLDPIVLTLPVLRVASEFRPLYYSMSGQFYSIFPNMLREPQKAVSDKVLSEGGENFVAVVREISKNRIRFLELLTILRKVVEGVTNLKVEAAGSYLVTYLQHSDVGTVSESEMGDQSIGQNGPWFDLGQESDGTIRLLGILVALYQQLPVVRRGKLLALEEPEMALHPGALPILCDVFLEASKRQQIIITTQSPDLIEGFNIESLRVVERVDGVSEVGKVDPNQREVVNRQLFTAGELIRSEGLRRAKSNKGEVVTGAFTAAKKVARSA